MLQRDMWKRKEVGIMYVFFISFELILVCTVRERNQQSTLQKAKLEIEFGSQFSRSELPGSGVKSRERAAGELPGKN